MRLQYGICRPSFLGIYVAKFSKPNENVSELFTIKESNAIHKTNIGSSEKWKVKMCLGLYWWLLSIRLLSTVNTFPKQYILVVNLSHDQVK